MPNALTAAGLTTATIAEMQADLTTKMQGIYGSDINLDPQSPDMQALMIFIQAARDILDLVEVVYGSFDPDAAFDRTLDSRVALNGIQRQGGTYTYTPITMIVSQGGFTLQGLDNYPNDPYTISDDAGTQWYLTTTTSPSAAGTLSLTFRSALPGATLTTLNTINVPVTVVLGVTSVNNPSAATVLGLDEETNAQLKIRRQKSVALSSQGFLASILAALENISGVLNAIVYENNTGSADADGTPGHCMWAIVEGGASADIANAIYQKRNTGCSMRGLVQYNVLQADGSLFPVYWDVVTDQQLYLNFSLVSIETNTATTDPAVIAAVKNYIVSNFRPGIYERVNVNELAAVVQAANPNEMATFLSTQGFGLTSTGTFYNILRPTAKNLRFKLTAANITINGV